MHSARTATHTSSPEEACEITSLSKLFEWIDRWHGEFASSSEVTKRDYVWYRGHEEDSYKPSPTIYRLEIDDLRHRSGRSLESARLHLEREFLHQFRTTGAHLMHQANDDVALYLLARHHGLPSRLLDWTTDPLTALFFAVNNAIKKNKDDKDDKKSKEEPDGHVLIMDARHVSADSKDMAYSLTRSKQRHGRKYGRPTHVHSIRMPYVEAAIERMFWREPVRSLEPFTVIPIRPDNQIGRIFQQSSCFTFHMDHCPEVKNHTMWRAVIPSGAKKSLRKELSRANVNCFSIYCDLDHLAKHIKINWGVEG